MKLDFYARLEAIILKHLSQNKINPELTLVISPAIINEVVKKFGGNMVYMKNKTREQTNAKHQAIMGDFDGSNHAEVCQKHRITQAWLKKLLKRAAENETV